MTETRTIEVKAYRCKQENMPTCARDFNSKEFCQFIRTQHFGTVDVCGITGDVIERDQGGKGWLRPVEGCPVWGEK
jgi:hypothetical protein